MEKLKTEVLVVGGGTGGTAAAIQSARCGVQTVLVSEFSWLGGMLTTAGVSAPDGNELAAFQTGLWGAFLRELYRRQAGGLDHGWVSFFTFEPRIGAEIFADWVRTLPSLHWIAGQVPLEVTKQGDRLTQVRFEKFLIEAEVILDGTELGDLLALAEVPHRWGWEWQSVWDEPSAPTAANDLTDRYPVQAPTWVVTLQDFGDQQSAPEIAPSPRGADLFQGAWQGYDPEQFMNYGRLPSDRFMINWPQRGNDYAEGVHRLIGSPAQRQAFLQEALWHSQDFARFIQVHLGRRYGLAHQTFPMLPADDLGGGAYALHPYYRESRRLQGLVTVREQDLLPQAGGRVALLPRDQSGLVEAIALGNYANDHHYPNFDWSLQSKSMRWGGRWTGTPFALPYRCLIPAETEGLLVCEKNISVSHIANGATRLQPVVLNVGQAAGMAAALCIRQACQPRQLPVRMLQEALIKDREAPAAVIPLLNSFPADAGWQYWQHYYLDQPDAYPLDGNCPTSLANPTNSHPACSQTATLFEGIWHREADQAYTISLLKPIHLKAQTLSVVTLYSAVEMQLKTLKSGQLLSIWGRYNASGKWLLAEKIRLLPTS